MHAHLLHIEEAALNAWPALKQVLYDGWVLRFSAGYTKRANSANPVYASTLPLEQKIAECEARYSAQHLPPIFRLTSRAAPPELDTLLEQRGYTVVEPTLVLHRPLDGFQPPALPPDCAVTALPLDNWLAVYCDLQGAALGDHAIHCRMLQQIMGRCFFAVLRVADVPVACGLAVVEGHLGGVFDVVTAPMWRNQGYGSLLLGALLGWMQNAGAQWAYLSVVRANTPARHVYEAKWAFTEAYHYHYRVLR